MIIKRISLLNFRSHESFDFLFSKSTTMLTGENGCGKTSVLEAIYEGCQGKSFKATDKEIFRRGSNGYRVDLEFINGEKTIVRYDSLADKKRFLVQDKEVGRLPKINKYPIVLFLPEDLGLIGTSPTKKRNYFDRMISQLSVSYSEYLSKFNKVLKQRNDLLKEEYLSDEALFSWNVLLSKYGSLISKTRQEICEKINFEFTNIYRSIADNKDEIMVRFDTEVQDESQYLRNLTNTINKDKILQHTSFGTHKDNFVFLFNKKEADGVASRGEMRSVMLALKFIEAKMIEKELNKKPLVLLDDVFSELDEKRQRALSRNFKENQVIITSVKGV